MPAASIMRADLGPTGSGRRHWPLRGPARGHATATVCGGRRAWSQVALASPPQPWPSSGPLALSVPRPLTKRPEVLQSFTLHSVSASAATPWTRMCSMHARDESRVLLSTPV
jgi:hypothetical protein